MITNEAGQVAMVYYQPIPGLREGYFFDVKHGVAMSWVNPQDVGRLLAVRAGCCGGQRQAIFPANANQVSVWSDGKYP